MPKEDIFYVEFDSVANSVGRFGWKIKSRKTEGYNIIAHCETKTNAEVVANALNFNASPSKYGYKLVVD